MNSYLFNMSSISAPNYSYIW